MDNKIKNKKETFYVCHTCKKINPIMIMIENYDTKDDQPYEIQLLLPDPIKKSYKKENVILREKNNGKTYKLYKCGHCKMNMDIINEDNAERVIKYLNKTKL